MKRPSLWQRLGPGILLAATSVGASHLVLSPQAGALYGFSLLWLVLASHLFKYPAFEFGPRYAAATGNSLLAGYKTVPGPQNWSLYLFLFSTILQGVAVLGGVVGICGTVIASWIGDPGSQVVAALDMSQLLSLGALSAVIVLLFFGGFSLLDHLNKLMMAGLTVATIFAFIPVAPSPGELSNLVIPTVPAGSIVLIAAILGWMPTGIDVSVWHSFWTLEKMNNLGEGTQNTTIEDKIRRVRSSLSDMRIGYTISLITGIMFVTIGAAHLAGKGADLKGIQFAEAISTAYTAIFGRWMYHVFMMTAFFAMFSTTYTVIDGFSRAFSEALALVAERQNTIKNKSRSYRGFVIISSLCAAIIIVFVGNPVTLILTASLVSLSVAPVLYALNVYVMKRDVTTAGLQPHKITFIIGWAGIAFMIVALAVMIYVKLIM